MRFWLFLLGLLGCSVLANAQESLSVCFNYGCLDSAEVHFSPAQLDEVQALLGDAASATHERALLAVVIGRLLRWAGEQSPIHADRGGNVEDAFVSGRMDCIDHAITTTRLLHLLARRGVLHWHRVLEPVMRRHILIFEHWSALIEENPAPFGTDPGLPDPRDYVVDSWFRDNGEPAVIMPLMRWMDWEEVSDDE